MKYNDNYHKQLNLICEHFKKYDPKSISEILNNSIVQICENDEYGNYSLKIMMACSIIVFSFCLKNEDENVQIDYDNLENEISKFKEEELKLKNILFTMYKYENGNYNIKRSIVYNRNYFDFNLMSVGDIIKFFEAHKDFLKKYYGFNLYGKTLKFLLAITNGIKPNYTELGISLQFYPPILNKNSNMPTTISKLAELMKSSFISFFDHVEYLRIIAKNTFDISNEDFNKIIDKLFLNIRDKHNLDSIISSYPDKLYKNLSGYIGIKYNDFCFIPKSHYMLTSLVENAKDVLNNKNKYGHEFERSVLDKFKSFFGGKQFNYKLSYKLTKDYNDGKKEEQDIMIKNDNIVFIVECKSNGFKGVSKDYDKRVKKIIGRGITQANRVEKNIVANNGHFIDHKGNKFDIKYNKNLKIYKVIVTSSDYSKLAIDPAKYLNINSDDIKNTLVINYYTLSNILFYCKNHGYNIFSNYIEKKGELNKAFESFHEMDYFKYFIATKQLSIHTNAKVWGPNISDDMLDNYDNHDYDALKKLENYIEENNL